MITLIITWLNAFTHPGEKFRSRVFVDRSSQREHTYMYIVHVASTRPNCCNGWCTVVFGKISVVEHFQILYTTFALSWASWTYSCSGISGMFHPRKTGCNLHVPIHGNCDIVRLTSSAYKLKHDVSLTYNYFDEISITGGITVGSVSCTVKVTGLSQAMVVRIVHDRRRLAEGKQFPRSNKTLW